MTAPGPLDVAYTAAVNRNDHQQAQLLEYALESLRQPPPIDVHPAQAAVWYAGIGLRTFPLQPGRKIPYKGSRGVKDAVTDPSAIERWWQVAPESNVGIATGGLADVIDIDEQAGADAFCRMLTDDTSWLHILAIGQTPRGLHLWVPAVPGARNGGAEYEIHVDYRAEGGYVVVPPSHVDGTMYRWLAPPGL